MSQHLIIISKKDPLYYSDSDFMKVQINYQQSYFNDVYDLMGYLPLYEVYKYLGIEQFKLEWLLEGWKKSEIDHIEFELIEHEDSYTIEFECLDDISH